MPQVPVAKVLQRLAQGQVDPLYLLFGEETYLIQEYTAAFIERILGTAPRDFNCDVFNADSETLKEALSIAAILPMMAVHRVVVLHGLQQLRKSDLQQLETYAEQPAASTALICSSTESNSAKFPPHFWHQVLAVECSRLEGAPLRTWVGNTIRRSGYAISEEALQELLRDQQNDLWLLAQEIDKLCTYVGTPRAITLADVREVCQTSRLYSVFALSDAIGTHHVLQALTVAESLLDQGEPPLVVLSMIIRHLRLLWSSGQLVQQRQDITQVAKTLGLPVHICRRLVAQSHLFPPQRLRQLYTAALEADLAFKTSTKPPRAILESLILELCSRS
jgi:DNA polymerase-3 subunit delta